MVVLPTTINRYQSIVYAHFRDQNPAVCFMRFQVSVTDHSINRASWYMQNFAYLGNCVELSWSLLANFCFQICNVRLQLIQWFELLLQLRTVYKFDYIFHFWIRFGCTIFQRTQSLTESSHTFCIVNQLGLRMQRYGKFLKNKNNYLIHSKLRTTK
mgnify:FL=1